VDVDDGAIQVLLEDLVLVGALRVEVGHSRRGFEVEPVFSCRNL